jgi:hypothetical protein
VSSEPFRCRWWSASVTADKIYGQCDSSVVPHGGRLISTVKGCRMDRTVSFADSPVSPSNLSTGTASKK